MIIRLTKYFLIFFSLLLINIFLGYKIYNYFKRNTKIIVILEEITRLENQPNLPVLGTNIKLEKDSRVATLKSFFRQHDSPLYDFAEQMVRVADKYGLDFKLLPAIAMQESNLCKVIPPNSYNCWGWGIYGNNVIRFSSYDEAIEIVARGLKTHYIDKGLITPEEIMRKYNPSSPNGNWAIGVNSFLRVLDW